MNYIKPLFFLLLVFAFSSSMHAQFENKDFAANQKSSTNTIEITPIEVKDVQIEKVSPVEIENNKELIELEKIHYNEEQLNSRYFSKNRRRTTHNIKL